jgi:hypothetical protein
MITVVELPEFIRRSKKLLNETERERIVYYLAAHPASGVIIECTGGIRKLRWKREGSGFDSIKQGLTEAIDFAQGKTSKAVVHEFSPIIDVKAIREKIGMSQSEFATWTSTCIIKCSSKRTKGSIKSFVSKHMS